MSKDASIQDQGIPLELTCLSYLQRNIEWKERN